MNARVSYSFQRFPYGARYVACPARSRGNPKISLWLSVDPLAEKYPGVSPYVYTLANPVRLIDPDGRAPTCCPNEYYLVNWRGFYINSPGGYSGGIYLGNVKPNVDRYYELVSINGRLYHKNTDFLSFDRIKR